MYRKKNENIKKNIQSVTYIMRYILVCVRIESLKIFYQVSTQKFQIEIHKKR